MTYACFIYYEVYTEFPLLNAGAGSNFCLAGAAPAEAAGNLRRAIICPMKHSAHGTYTVQCLCPEQQPVISSILCMKERSLLPAGQLTSVSLPFPSTWYIHADIAGRPIIYGTLVINSVRNNRVTGAINFRGNFIPIQGSWNESAKQIAFDSPYAHFVGNLTMMDEQRIPVRHFILRGRFIMKPPSIQAGEYGTWVAATDISLNQNPSKTYAA
jgi:hypothetical protein